MRQTWILDIPQTPQQHKRILYNFFLKRNNCLFFYIIIIEFVEWASISTCLICTTAKKTCWLAPLLLPLSCIFPALQSSYSRLWIKGVWSSSTIAASNKHLLCDVPSLPALLSTFRIDRKVIIGMIPSYYLPFLKDLVAGQIFCWFWVLLLVRTSVNFPASLPTCPFRAKYQQEVTLPFQPPKSSCFFCEYNLMKYQAGSWPYPSSVPFH